MIFRLLLLFFIIWFLLWIIKKQFTSANRPDTSVNKQSAEDIIACSYCGVHTPMSSGVMQNGKFYCTEQHAQQDLPESKHDD